MISARSRATSIDAAACARRPWRSPAQPGERRRSRASRESDEARRRTREMNDRRNSSEGRPKQGHASSGLGLGVRCGSGIGGGVRGAGLRRFRVRLASRRVRRAPRPYRSAALRAPVRWARAVRRARAFQEGAAEPRARRRAENFRMRQGLPGFRRRAVGAVLPGRVAVRTVRAGAVQRAAAPLPVPGVSRFHSAAVPANPRCHPSRTPVVPVVPVAPRSSSRRRVARAAR